MTTIQAIILGIIQGITEFLPVSSSGHLRLARELFGFMGGMDAKQDRAFDVLLHTATLLVIIFVFRNEIISLLKGRRRLWLALAIGSIPAGLAGVAIKLLLKDWESPLWAISCCYLCLGSALIFGERKMADNFGLDEIKPKYSFFIGIAQMCAAFFPGVSRSGSTILTGGWLGLKRQDAITFSFLLSLIAVGGATILEFKDIVHISEIDWKPPVAGFLTAFVLGMASIWLLKRIVAKRRLAWFGPYCLVLGIVAMIKVIWG
jgi:undecaprenyl-diphosphatase